jgi:hypothetical protein
MTCAERFLAVAPAPPSLAFAPGTVRDSTPGADHDCDEYHHGELSLTDAVQHVCMCIQHVPNNSGSDRAPRPYGAATKSAPRAPVQRLVAETCPADLTIRSCQKHSLNHTYYACLALVVCPSLLAESSPAHLLRCRHPFAFVNSLAFNDSKVHHVNAHDDCYQGSNANHKQGSALQASSCLAEPYALTLISLSVLGSFARTFPSCFLTLSLSQLHSKACSHADFQWIESTVCTADTVVHL